jgi:hypothetical protein
MRVGDLDLFLEGLGELDVKALSRLDVVIPCPFTVRDDVLAVSSFHVRGLLRPLANPQELLVFVSAGRSARTR